MSKFFNNTTKALDSFLNNKASEALNKLPTNARNLIGAVLPGLGGGVDQNNVFARQFENIQVFNSTDAAAQIRAGEQTGGLVGNKFDWRARLRPKAGGAQTFYKDSPLLQPIRDSGGLIWQYTPVVLVSTTVNYDTQSLQGSNYPIKTFQSSVPQDIQVTCEFTANTIMEAKYMLAVMHFLRVATKSYYGEKAVLDGTAGTPPPVLLFEYLGDHGYDKVPVVITNFSYTLPDTVDYVPVEVNGGVTYLPTSIQISVMLSIQYTPHKVRKEFDLAEFTQGNSYRKGFS